MKNIFNLLVFLSSKGHGIFRTQIIDFFIEGFLNFLNKIKIFGSWSAFSENYIETYRDFEPSDKFIKDPGRFLESMAIVLKSPSKAEKGVIVIAYNYAFPTFALLFDIQRIFERYHIILEPSTARYLMPEILMFKAYDETIYIETGEPRDARFLNRFMKNVHSIPVAANWWVDYRIFDANPEQEKSYDLIMVASWLKLKRHDLLFRTLSKMKAKGRTLKCVLVGYPIDMTREEIVNMIDHYNLTDQIELYEWLSQKEVAQLLQKSRLNLLLSKKEGFNRSIIEGMFCDVPCLIRKGFNFNHQYNYMNDETGAYYEDNKLEEAIENALTNIDQFKPRKWLLENGMTAQSAASIIEKEIFQTDEGKVSAKVSGLNGMEYWDKNGRDKYESDYDFLIANLNKQQ